MDESVTVLTEHVPRIARALSADPGIRLVASVGADCDVVVTPARAARLILVESGRRTGARGLVSVDTCPTELHLAVRAVARGARYVASELVEPPEPSAPTRLAPREVETLSWLARGFTHRQIAQRMRVAVATVDTYVKRLRGKLSAGNKAQLTRTAIELGLVTV